MAITVTVGRARTTLDLLLWRAYGRRGCTSAMLARAHAANPGLAALGPVLPRGRVVILPDLPIAANRGAVQRKTVNLFGDA